MRSERRRHNRRPFQRSAKQIRAEGGSVYQLDVMPFFDAVFHERGCQVIRHLVESVTSDKAPLCVLCDAEISLAEPPAFIIAIRAPGRDLEIEQPKSAGGPRHANR